MEEYAITETFLEKVEEQFTVWALFLNNAIGILAFTLNLACLGTNTPWINACFSIFILYYVWRQGNKHFPETIVILRDKAKIDKKAKLLLSALNAEHFSFRKVIKRYPVYLVGFVLLVVTAGSPLLHNFIVMLFGSADWFGNYFKL